MFSHVAGDVVTSTCWFGCWATVTQWHLWQFTRRTSTNDIVFEQAEGGTDPDRSIMPQSIIRRRLKPRLLSFAAVPCVDLPGHRL